MPVSTIPYKNRMCKNWKNKGECPHGQYCHFVHGLGQLKQGWRKKNRKICPLFHCGDVCYDGKKCKFIHYFCEYKYDVCSSFYNYGICDNLYYCTKKHK